MTERTSITIRLNQTEKEKFADICKALGFSQQQMLKHYVDRILENEEEIREKVTPVSDQVLDIALGGSKNV